MGKIKYLIFAFLFLTLNLFAETKKVYFYTTESNINDFKSLKINFDEYLSHFGNYEFQAFNKKNTFESYLRDDNIVVILSSWHYSQIAQKYNLKAKLVALKKDTITDTKVIVGRKNSPYDGTLTTAFSKDYTKELISKLVQNNKLNVLNVPKEIDALMSVGFGMSKFALVSKDSFELLKKVNPFLAEQMVIYKESTPSFRMILASKMKEKFNKQIVEIFTNMNNQEIGRKILSMLKIDDIVVLTKSDLALLRGEK